MATYAGSNIFSSSGTLPDDSAPATGANINPFLEMLADRTVWLKDRTGDFRLVAEGETASTDGAVVQLGGTPVTFTSTSFLGDATHFPLASLAVVAGDVVEFEITGSVAGFAAFGGMNLIVIVDDGSTIAVPHAAASWDAPAFQIVQQSTEQADAGTIGTWTGGTWGAPSMLISLSDLVAGDQVEMIAKCVAYGQATGGSGSIQMQLRLETTESGGSSTLETGTEWVSRTIPVGSVEVDVAIFAMLHTVAVKGGFFVVSMNGQVVPTGSPTGNSMSTSCPYVIITRVYRAGVPTSPFAIVGRYVVTTTGTMPMGLDGKLGSSGAGTHFDIVQALACKWRVLRSDS
jgi:hypothetical protein